MPLRSGGAIESEHLKGKVSVGVNTRALAGTFEPVGLAPQKVAEVEDNDATRDTYQRKVLFDAVRFFVVYWDGGTTKRTRYASSTDGETWASPITLFEFSVAPYFGGNIDMAFQLDSTTALIMAFIGSNGSFSYIYPYTISGATLILGSGGSLAQVAAHGGGLCIHPNRDYVRQYYIMHRSAGVWAQINPASYTEYNTSVTYDGTHATGPNALLPYQISGAGLWRMLALCINASNVLMWNLMWPLFSGTWKGYENFNSLVTVQSGFSSFCAASEALMAVPSEIVHLVYIKSTGELCYNKFENDSFGVERVLVTSGASYPVIAVGSGGKLYVFCVKDGKIWVIHFNGISWLGAVELFTSEHTYNNPVYLSSNQNVQSDRICLVWTEGTSTPYEVWFCYLED